MKPVQNQVYDWERVNIGLGRSRKQSRGLEEECYQKCIIGITTKRLFKKAKKITEESETILLHLDATFKLNLAGFEVFVFGISDRNGIFHVLAIFLSSCREKSSIDLMFESINILWRSYFKNSFHITHLMSDADKATASMWTERFQDARCKLLMCFTHVRAAVSKNNLYFYLFVIHFNRLKNV
jgi:hypothetical protein